MALGGPEQASHLGNLHAIRLHDQLHDRVAQHLVEQRLWSGVGILALGQIGRFGSGRHNRAAGQKGSARLETGCPPAADVGQMRQRELVDRR
jgi:hypothetical protein